MIAIADSYDFELLDWRQAVFDELPMQNKATEFKNLFGFGTSIGDGHLNHSGHKTYSQALEKFLVNYVLNVLKHAHIK